MLTLMLLRHAKAVAYCPAGDFERDLTDQGHTHALRLGAYLEDEDLRPDLALVSSAKRTTRTFEAVRSGMTELVPARFEPSLYSATPAQIRDVLRIVAPGIARLLIVGHNPSIAEAAIALSVDGDRREIARMSEGFPTCALAVITFGGEDWRDARASGGRLDLFLTPEDLSAT